MAAAAAAGNWRGSSSSIGALLFSVFCRRHNGGESRNIERASRRPWRRDFVEAFLQVWRVVACFPRRVVKAVGLCPS